MKKELIVLRCFYIFCHYYHSEYFKIFDGNGVLKFHQSGCLSSVHGLLVEVPFFASNNITASFNMRRLRSTIKADYLILGKSVHAGKPQYRLLACHFPLSLIQNDRV